MMSPNMVSWRPSGAPRATPTFVAAWQRVPKWSRVVGMAGACLAFVLLWGFYSIVQGAVHRAEAGREQARVAVERQAVCSAFSAASSRELCAVTIAAHAATNAGPANSVLRASYKQPLWTARKPELTAAVY